MEELRAIQRKTERTVNRVGKQMGDLNNRFGELAEHLVAPGIIRRFNEMGYYLGEGLVQQLKILDRDTQNVLTEIDLLLENEEYLIAVEVKSRPALKDVAHHERRLEILREYKNRRNDQRKIRGGIAGAVFPEGVKEAVIEAGLYVIEQSGDTMKISVPPGFIPREW
jgi:predicted AAA+ superfamily ATPase